MQNLLREKLLPNQPSSPFMYNQDRLSSLASCIDPGSPQKMSIHFF
jgi:hypothetical protein